MEGCENYDCEHRHGAAFTLAILAIIVVWAFAGVAIAADDPPATTASASSPSSMSFQDYAGAPSTATGPNADKIARGKYLVTIAGCNDCHTPVKMGPNGPEPDVSRLLSGHPEQVTVTAPAPNAPQPWLYTTTLTAWTGPWGVSFTANLTPDPETGLGKWTVRNFKDTIRSGRHQGRGREILPPMPIPMYRHMKDEDLEAVFAYLQSIPPVKNHVPEPLPPAAAAGSSGM
jgi:mono/diheme cytochrome c family protein